VEKAELRRMLRQRRAAREDATQRARLAEGLAALRRDLDTPTGPGAVVAAFLPTAAEPDVTGCLVAAHAAGERVLVPRTLPDCQLAWAEWTPQAPLQPDRHGLFAPIGAATSDGLSGSTVLLLPALAVDLRGTRLGHGAGYYDRALARLPAWPQGPLRVAVVHPAEVLDDPLPREPHDAAVDAVLTADGWHRTVPGVTE
jgi:5-formyltetrahydrofolate cyclo-ligase